MNNINITLFTSGCPKCTILKSKLDGKNIQYEINESNFTELEEHGFDSLPVLKITNTETNKIEYLDFKDSVKYINEI